MKYLSCRTYTSKPLSSNFHYNKADNVGPPTGNACTVPSRVSYRPDDITLEESAVMAI
jgi:hypothetical protein